jgi:hypothetical protein
MALIDSVHKPSFLIQILLFVLGLGLNVSHRAALSSRCLGHSPNDVSRTRIHKPMSYHRNDTYQDGCATK